MLRRSCDIYSSQPVRQLFEAQERALLPSLQRCVGAHALLIGTCSVDSPPPLPLVGCWTRLWIDSPLEVRGDLRASAKERLPFVDDAFDLVLLRHALETFPGNLDLLEESVRVLSAGGVLAITGLHPLSGWAPWFCWRVRGGRHRLQMPFRLRQRLQDAGLEIEAARRVGTALPGSRSDLLSSSVGGGFVLLARKQTRVVTPLRVKPTLLRAAAARQLAPGTPRTAAASRSRTAA